MNHPLHAACIQWADREGGFFMDWEKHARQLMKGEMGSSLQSILSSETGAKLAQTMDGHEVEEAARSGDTQALSEMLRKVLSTPEGKDFAEQVRKTVNGHGR